MMPSIPSRYLSLLQNLPARIIEFGYGGIELFEANDLANRQVGYSVNPDGDSLCGYAAGDWKAEWIVIGCELGLGDPLILDTSDDKLAVITAMHGEGSWQPEPVSSSVESFLQMLIDFRELARERENPVKLEAHPLDEVERSHFLEQIAASNGTLSAPDYWQALIDG
jgi:hypothetical protein